MIPLAETKPGFGAGHEATPIFKLVREDEKIGQAQSMNTELATLAEICIALDEDRFRLFAQKIVPTEGECSSDAPNYELLVRMVDRDGALVPPVRFIGTAERYGIMPEVDRWVLSEALLRRDMEICRLPNFSISINLSAQSLNDPAFLPFFTKVMANTCLPANRITIEITETALIENLKAASIVLDQVRALGCRVALDDFGVGLSSFHYIKNFKVDYIKIDGSFARNIARSPADLAIVKAINTMAHDLDIETVAEFVEDLDVLERLRELKVDFGQGYALGRPGPLEEMMEAARDEKPKQLKEVPRVKRTVRARRVQRARQVA